MAKIRLLVFLDKTALDKKPRVENALLSLKNDYIAVSGLDLVWDYEVRDFTGIKFVSYNNVPGDLGVDFSYISNLAKECKQKYAEQYDNLVLVIDKDNWQAINPIGGWNMGIFYSGYQVEQVKLVDSDEWIYKIFSMEIFHAMDNFVKAELNIDLSSYLGVLDFDEDVVHGRKNPPYQAFEYDLAISQIGSLLVKCFEKRNLRYQKYINDQMTIIDLLKRLLVLYRQLLKLRGITPSAVELTEKVAKHHKH